MDMHSPSLFVQVNMYGAARSSPIWEARGSPQDRICIMKFASMVSL